MAAATLFDSGYQAFIDIIDVLLFGVATIPPNLVKISQKLRERPKFFTIQDGGSGHVDFRLPGVFGYHRCVDIQSRNIPTNFGEHCSRNE